MRSCVPQFQPYQYDGVVFQGATVAGYGIGSASPGALPFGAPAPASNLDYGAPSPMMAANQAGAASSESPNSFLTLLPAATQAAKTFFTSESAAERVAVLQAELRTAIATGKPVGVVAEIQARLQGAQRDLAAEVVAEQRSAELSSVARVAMVSATGLILAATFATLYRAVK